MSEYPFVPRDQEYADEMPGYFMAQYYSAPVLTAMVEGLLEAVENVETAVLALRTIFGASSAEGAWLDILGDEVGERRDGLSDAIFRNYIRARIAINRSNGTADELANVVRLLYGDDDAVVTVEDAGEAEILLEIYSSSAGLDVDGINDRLQDARAAGVLLQWIYWPDDEDAIFAFADVPNTIETGDAAKGFANIAMSTGGKLAGVLVTS